MGAIDDAHAAFSNLLDDAITTEDLTKHGHWFKSALSLRTQTLRSSGRFPRLNRSSCDDESFHHESTSRREYEFRTTRLRRRLRRSRSPRSKDAAQDATPH